MAYSCYGWCPCRWKCWRRKKKPGAKDGSKSSVRIMLSRVPVASAVAFFMCSGGILVFGISMYEALEYLVILFDLKIIGIVSWTLMGFHVLVASYFLLVATLCTGRTREEINKTCTYINLVGRCAQAGCMCLAYLLHLIWLFLPAIMLIPVGILTGVVVLCRLLPNCITLSDYGVDPALIDKYHPETLMKQVREFNESVILDYAGLAEDFLLKTIDNLEDSPILENIISQIEKYIPDEEEAEKFITNILQYLDLSQLINVLGQAEKGIDFIDKLTEMISQIPNMTTYVDMLTDMRPNIEDTIGNHTSKLQNNLSKYLDEADSHINKTADELDNVIDTINDTISKGIGEVDQKFDNYKNDAMNNISRINPEEKVLSNVTDLSIHLEGKLPNTDSMNKSSVNLESRHSPQLNSTIQYPEVELPNMIKTDTESLIPGTLGSGQNITDTIQDEVDEFTGDIQDTLHSAMTNVKEAGEDTLTDLQENAENIVDDIHDHIGNVGEMTAEFADDVKEGAEKTARELIKEARFIAQEAEKAAQGAAEEAEIAVKRAEQFAREAAEEIDVNAKVLAMDLAEKAKMAAERAKRVAAEALNKAQMALQEADEIVKAAAMGAFAWAKEAMGKLRYYAKKVFSSARKAVVEARKGAKIVVKYVGVAKKELIKAYEYAKELYRKIRIYRLGQDTFCSDFKVEFCSEIGKSHICMILALISSVIINLSMVHFLMAMAANYVHLMKEHDQHLKSKSSLDVTTGVDCSAERSMLMFSRMDTGSIEIHT